MAKSIARKRMVLICAVSILVLVLAFGAISYFPNSVARYFDQPSAKNSGGAADAQAAATDEVYPLPKSNLPAANFYVTNTGGQGDPMSYTMSALAGLVARDSPQLYLVQASGDNTWLSYIENTYGIHATSISNTQALTQFESYFENSQGQVKIIEYDVNDSYFPMQVNMAATLAGVYSALPVANSEISTIDSIFGAKNVDVEYNLVGMFTGNNESSVKVAAYTWLWTLTGGQTTKAFFSMNPEGRADLDDYIVEFKAFQFEFCCVDLNAVNNQAPPLTAAELAFTSKVLGTYPPNTVDVGYVGLGTEGYTISILSELGMSEVADPELSDLSFMSGFPTLMNLNQAVSSQTALNYNSSKVYVFFEFTQGDALTFDAYTNWGLYNAVDPSTGVPYRDEIPVAWQINPIMAVVDPPVMQAYYSEQQGSLDDFITGPSGGSGYNNPDRMGQYEAEQNSMSHIVSQNAGIGTYFVIFGGNPFSSSIEQTYVQEAQPKAVLLWQKGPHAPTIVDGVPFMTDTFWLPLGNSYTQANVSNTVSTIRSDAQSSHFVYVIMNAQNPGFPFISQVLNNLGPNYQPVNAEQYISLYCQSQKQSCNPEVTQSSTTSSQPLTTTKSTTLTTTRSTTLTTTLTHSSTETSTFTSTITTATSISGTNSTLTYTKTGTTTFEKNYTTTITTAIPYGNSTNENYAGSQEGSAPYTVSANSTTPLNIRNGLEGEEGKTVAATMAAGTSAIVFLGGLVPLMYLFRRNVPIRRKR